MSRYDDVVAVMRDDETFSSSQGIGFERCPTRDIVSADPPEHTRLRRLVNRQFRPRVIAALEPRVVAIVDELVDGMLEKGTVDLAADLAEPLPAAAQRLEAFDQRLGDLRQRHAKKRAFLQRLERADLGAGPPHGGAQR